MPYFKDCIGALDGTHIQASVPNDIVARFRTGWEGSAHDALVLRNALEREDGLVVPEGKYYLVDAGYSTQPGKTLWDETCLSSMFVYKFMD
ncbi:hypothetical protein J5N97_008077 [Dioscorea zingiberensis]|uniref:DDE Tnp4 domain-containing protein n=1 Tax=Dioscorea zingiberensis TaxID=325984 RepID=A0A9D5DD65_9LILI|nr:hypothetical protein J5N97_008077 [Dioscorea zingiberensis]